MSVKPRGFDWDLYEPGAWRTEYGGIDHSIDFVLAPVTAWERSTRLEMENDMMIRELKVAIAWGSFIGMKSLVAQLSTLSVRGPEKYHTGLEKYDHPLPALLKDYRLVTRALDWIWQMYRCRLANRVHRAACADGMSGLNGVCDGVAERFDFFRQAVGLTYKVKPAPKTAPIEERIAAMQPWEDHELNLVINARGWNGWEEDSWLRFVRSADHARQEYAEFARDRDAESAREEGSPESNDARITTDGAQPLGGYFAPEYAEKMRQAFSDDPSGIRSYGRSAFKQLRKAAGISETNERTVKRRLGYEGNAGGFEHFIALLYAAVGERPPK